MASGDLERGTKNGNNNNNNNSGYGSYYVETSDKEWTSWLIPMFVVANVCVFIVVMYINNCPKNNLGFEGGCVAKFLGRLSFQPLKENPLLGPSSSTSVF
uniref:rhomboid protease n=1 Tax=Rhizophora mucronata TaxID=61149 RepID=A0A2P2JJJ8_RHIMU